MSSLPGYDEWKTHNPDDDRCEFCGVSPYECRGGWQPRLCTGECRQVWRDPDFERDQMIDAGTYLDSLPDPDGAEAWDYED